MWIQSMQLKFQKEQPYTVDQLDHKAELIVVAIILSRFFVKEPWNLNVDVVSSYRIK